MIDPESKEPRARNYLRAALFQGPEWIPCSVGILPATWRRHRGGLEDVLADHPRLFPGFRKGQTDFDSTGGDKTYAAGTFTDNWGCGWENLFDGMVGAVVESPLEDWDAFAGWQPPDPLTEGDGWGHAPDWDGLRRRCQEAKEGGWIAAGGIPHGFMYMRLYYLRGFIGLMMDIGRGDERLGRLIETVLDHNLALIRKTIECGVEMIHFGDDMGTQKALPISPDAWRRYLGPCYRQMFGLCVEAGVAIYLHSDGHILEIIPDLIDAGMAVVNPQIRANGLDGLERAAKGRVCINLDLDRQLFPFVGPREVQDHIMEAVDRLAMPEGGLMLCAECGPDVPLENIRAICETFSEVGGA